MCFSEYNFDYLISGENSRNYFGRGKFGIRDSTETARITRENFC